MNPILLIASGGLHYQKPFVNLKFSSCECDLFRGDIHTHFVIHNFKMPFSKSTLDNISTLDILHRYHMKQNNSKRPTYYTMITLYTKIENIAIKTKFFTWVSHMALQAVSWIDRAFKFCSRKFNVHAQLWNLY